LGPILLFSKRISSELPQLAGVFFAEIAFLFRVFLPTGVPISWKLSVQMGLVTEIISDAFKSTFLRNFFIFLIAKKRHHVALSMLGIRQRRLQ
jgi:hypothetical protein